MKSMKASLAFAACLMMMVGLALAVSAHTFLRGGAGVVGSLSDPPSGPALTTGYGTWTWGTQVADPGTHAATGWWWVKLNGKVVFFSSQNQVGFAGNFFGDWYDGNWFAFQASYGFFNNCSPDICAPYGFPTPVTPPNAPGPFTPSPDTTSITAPTGTVTSVDGVWTWGSSTGGGNYNVVLNGVPLVNRNASQMQINGGGNIFLLRDDSNWYAYLNYAFCPATAPTAGSIPITIDMTPSYIPHISVATGHSGNVVGSVVFTTSDGSPFAGTVSVTPDPALGAGASFLGYSGGNLVLTRDLTSGDLGTQAFDVYPTQNGVQLTSGAYYLNVGVDP